ncbi:methyltransferase domain-containing protein [Aeromonas sp. V90_14]|uniref:class I SAM-dependent methyltransferase n=1 Tax=Aeromonas sp. V90_14 TaxID=3044241 RepID=UPI00249D8E6A|nr:class I SAM-dependent methyltransferase [Aeromonas sp. V90_14]MDI3430367.1 methyltransferase domain-containing protein [Aeromonas sp. V90_14]
MGNSEFHCPLCDYHGELRIFRGRLHAQCPNCFSLERHRFQFFVLQQRFDEQTMKSMSALHFAPELCMRTYFSTHFGQYKTADLMMNGVDYKVDIQSLPFSDESFDFIFASHVLEHIQNDIKALTEIYRILKPNGMAILPVPIIREHTVEYDEPDPLQDYHVRAPGVDYYDRYKMIFSSVEIVSSFDVDPNIQPFIYSKEEYVVRDDEWVHPYWVEGRKFIDSMPICYR